MPFLELENLKFKRVWWLFTTVLKIGYYFNLSKENQYYRAVHRTFEKISFYLYEYWNTFAMGTLNFKQQKAEINIDSCVSR